MRACASGGPFAAERLRRWLWTAWAFRSAAPHAVRALALRFYDLDRAWVQRRQAAYAAS